MADTATLPRRTATVAPSHETLWRALCAAQADFTAPKRDKAGARSKYAPLDSVMDAVRPVLNRHGLVLSQPTHVEGETLYVETRITHAGSGDSVSGVYPAGLITLQHQQLGSGVTYAKRYGLLSLLGVAPEDEDDDGEKAGAAGGRREAPQLNSSQAKKADLWPRFVEKVRGFTDMNDLDAWWESAATQRAVREMPEKWQIEATEEYEKAQERCADLMQKQIDRDRENFRG